MHWCVYPSPTHSLIPANKQQNKSANTAQFSAMCCENTRHDWQLSDTDNYLTTWSHSVEHISTTTTALAYS